MSGLRAFLGELDQYVGNDDEFVGYLGYDDDYVGDDDDDEVGDVGAYLGARGRGRPAPRRGRRGGRPGMGIRPGAGGMVRQPVGRKAAAAINELDKSAGSPDALIEPLGFTPVIFVAGGATSLQARATPQRKFKGGRLFCDPARTGASAAGQLILVSSIKYGGRETLPSSDPVLSGSFAPTAFNAGLQFPVSGQGTIITVTYEIVGAALAGADTIAIGTQLNGLTVGNSE